MKASVVLFLVFFSSLVFAGTIGDSCNYYSNGDRECDSENGIYCTGYSCQYVADPRIYCIDNDSNNLAVSEDVNARYRDYYDGTWRNLINQDECINNNLFVFSCSGSLCELREATCIGTERVFETHKCDSCSNGACLSYVPSNIIGRSCNYQLHGDTECDSNNSIYCVNNTCQQVNDTSVYCNDSDTNNLSVKGTVANRSRQYNGEWTLNTLSDSCLIGTSPVSSCSATECKVQELTCIGATLQYNNFPCNSCNNGACAFSQDTNVIGKACDYYAYKDTQCNPDKNIFCIQNICTLKDKNTSSFCIDSDDSNYFNAGHIEFSYRRIVDGNFITGTAYDYCIDSNRVIEFKCENSWTEINYFSQIVNCTKGCSDKACIQDKNNSNQPVGQNCSNGIKDFDESGIDCRGAYCNPCSELPQTISDQQILSFISDWAQAKIDNNALLELIEIWKNSS